MGVMMQAFYWDCPKELSSGSWWTRVAAEIAHLKQRGFTSFWLPPACKGNNSQGMGYDPYDYYDLGEFNQKENIPTWFGSKDELSQLIKIAHENSVDVYADLVFNHNSGGDLEENPDNQNIEWYTKFDPLSGKFPRNYSCFHPSIFETYDDDTVNGFERTDLCHRNPEVYSELIYYSKWLLETIGFDGFRYDCVKGYGGWMVRAIQELRSVKNGKVFKPFGVGELWDNNNLSIHTWLNEVNAWTDNPVSAFDFPLRDKLRKMCHEEGYSLRALAWLGDTVLQNPSEAVTFVENHDTSPPHPDVADKSIVRNKMLAYAYILTHEGYPCVFWQDYYTYGLAQEGYKSGIAALVAVHEEFAAGGTENLWVDDTLYIMQRTGYGNKKGLVLVLNTSTGWRGSWVKTKWGNQPFVAAAWRGETDTNTPVAPATTNEGWAEFWAPPKGYAVYTPL